MSELHVTVKITVSEEGAEAFRRAATAFQAETRKEVGNLHCQVYQDQEKPNVFFLQQSYRDMDAALAHAASDHAAAYRDATTLIVRVSEAHFTSPL